MSDKFPHLNLPDIPLRLRREGAMIKIWDMLRKKYVALTPEEYVRQRFVAWLVSELRYPASLMNNEVSLSLNGLQRRCDTIVFDRTGGHLMIVEYKAPGVRITQDVFDQIARYNMALRASYLTVSNGLEHYCCRMDYVNSTYSFLPRIPGYDDAAANR